MSQGNWEEMQNYMRQILGDDGYQRMLEHMRTDTCHWNQNSGNVDAFMHDMMYGMMYQGLNNGATPAPGSCW